MNTPEFNNRKTLLASEIQTLLWLHDCVIIPGFGGLIGNYHPAQSHPVSHEFQPPSKQIAFNKHLHRDDGLLVRNIATRLSLDFSQARSWVEQTANALQQRLMAGEREALQKIGEFRMDVERNIVFYPETHQQYLPMAYGLYAFRATPVQRTQRIMPDPVVRPLPQPGQPIKRKTLRKTLLKLSPLLLLAIIPLLTKLSPEDPNKADLKINPFAAQIQAITIAPEPVKVQPILRKALLEENASFSAASAKIFIVAGCYSNGETALGRAEYLKSKGFEAAILDITPAGLYRVIYSAHDDIVEAKTEMEKIRSGLNEDAWLLIR